MSSVALVKQTIATGNSSVTYNLQTETILHGCGGGMVHYSMCIV